MQSSATVEKERIDTCPRLLPGALGQRALPQRWLRGGVLEGADLERAGFRFVEGLALFDADGAVAGGGGQETAEIAFDGRLKMQDFLDCIKSGKEPICDVETGHRSSSVCALANIAYWMNRPLEWDPKKEQFKNDAEANSYVKAKIRAPWKLV